MSRHYKTKREKCACRHIPDCKPGESNSVGQTAACSAQSTKFGENGTATEHGLKLDAQAYPTACQVPVNHDGDIEPLDDGGLAPQGVARVIQDEFGLNSRQLKDLFGGYGLSGIKRYLEEPEGSMYARSYNHLSQSEEDTQSYISSLTFYRPPSTSTSASARGVKPLNSPSP